MSDNATLNHLSRLGLTPVEQVEGLNSFEPGGAYQSHARPMAGMMPAIHFIIRDRTVTTCQYPDLDSGSTLRFADNGGDILTFRFKAALISEAIIEGRNLWQLYDCISRHRMPWVHELPAGRDFEAADAVVVNAITFRPAGF